MARDLVGYGSNPPVVEWPGGAQLALSLVLNYEEGSEHSPEYGDDGHEVSGELPSNRPREGRDPRMESQWGYGARAGVWRLMRIFKQYEVKATFFACALAVENNPPLGPEITAQGHTVSSHGYRWRPQWEVGRAAEKELIRKAADSLERTTGQRPLGWFTMGGQSEFTRELLREEGFLYDCDAFDDDLPYYTPVAGKPWLIVPYTFDPNDAKFWNSGSYNVNQFFQYLKDTFDVLYEEGKTHPKMMSVGLHSRIAGHPARALAVARFLEHVKAQPRVWVADRDEIARWWLEHYPPSQGS